MLVRPPDQEQVDRSAGSLDECSSIVDFGVEVHVRSPVSPIDLVAGFMAEPDQLDAAPISARCRLETHVAAGWLGCARDRSGRSESSSRRSQVALRLGK